MKAIRISLAQGADQSIDPRVAPNGTLSRVQNLRRDKEGRMVLRNGYQSLGTTVHDGGSALVPFDLVEHNGNLLALGNNSSANQTGIRAVYSYSPNAPNGVWRTSHVDSVANNTGSFVGITPADAPRILYSDAHSNADSNRSVGDIACTGEFVCTVTQQLDAGLNANYVEIVNATTGVLIYEQIFAGNNCRVIAVGTTFVVFMNLGNVQIFAVKLDTAVDDNFGSFTGLGSMAATDAPYDVANFEGSTTEYLIAFSTGTGYTWERRLLSTHAVQATSSVVSLAGAPVSICGASGETVNVVNQRTANGFELRTFATTGGAATLGPTNLDASALTFGWVGIARLSSTRVYVLGQQTTTSIDIHCRICATSAAHAPVNQTLVANARTATKPLIVDGIPFIWATLGLDTRRPYGLLALAVDGPVCLGAQLSTLALDGAAKTTYASAPASHHIAHIARGPGKKTLANLIALDSRDSRFRSHIFETEVFSGARRQAAAIGQTLYLAGGTLTQFDGKLSLEVGFDTAPAVFSVTQAAGGSLTLSGAYQLIMVFRCVARSGEVTQSAPSTVHSVTMTGGNQTLQVIASTPYSRRLAFLARTKLVSVFLDVYRTEAGGSIPRLSQSLDVGFSVVSIGSSFSFSETNADSVVQAGAKLYTQGADGAVSGRLPLSLASPCRFVVESLGKLWLAGLERRTQYQLSLENRPGEAAGFVNDDLFFGENSEDVTALAIGTDGRRLIFSASKTREVRGEGPNATGVGDLSEPLEVDGQVGAVDWRSVVKCEHGVLFRASDSKIYLLPVGGGAAINAAESIADVLEEFTVTTGAVRHDDDELVTFTVTNSAGTDGRLIHMDLRSSGMTREGWRSRWIVDRCALLEDVSEIQVLSDTVQFAEGLVSSFQPVLPQVSQAGDRFVLIYGASGTGASQGFFASGTGWSNRLSGFGATSQTGAMGVCERISSGVHTAVTITSGQAAAWIVRVLHLRGAHASQAIELVSGFANTASSINPAILTPTWGSAKNLWVAAALSGEVAFGPAPIPYAPLFVAYPDGFEFGKADHIDGTALLGCEMATCRRSLTAASLDPSVWGVGQAVNLSSVFLAIRPAGTAGTPVRAPVQFGRRLVVCNSTDVLRSTVGSFADQGNLFITAEIETADIYSMGPGGAGRHLSIVYVGEFRQRCVLGCELSYDSGQTYTECTPFRLDPSQYTVGQTVRVTWIPRRRKVNGVRARFRVTEDAGTGPSEGLAFHEALFYFEDLLGPARLPQPARK